jgi:hypothetical protein
MKFLIRVSIPTTQGNEMIKDPNFSIKYGGLY